MAGSEKVLTGRGCRSSRPLLLTVTAATLIAPPHRCLPCRCVCPQGTRRDQTEAELNLKALHHVLALTCSSPRFSTLCSLSGVVDLSFEAESPLAPPTELLETLPSCDWVLQGDSKCVVCRVLGLPASSGVTLLWVCMWNRLAWENSPVPWGPWEAPCHCWEGTGGQGHRPCVHGCSMTMSISI